MATNSNSNSNSRPSLLPEIGPDGLAREASVIAYTEKIIEEEQSHLRRYIEENYSKIRDVERELTGLTMEMKLTAGPKKAALEHMRQKIEISTEKIRVAKQKEDLARKALEAASKAVKDEEAIKQKLCEDLSNLVQESSNSQFSRLEELKRRLEALNPSRSSTSVHYDSKPPVDASSLPTSTAPVGGVAENSSSPGNVLKANGQTQQSSSIEGEGRPPERKVPTRGGGRGKGIGAVPKGRGSGASGWTGAGFDVDGRT